jgi:site-specific DNA recombinase
LGISELRNRFGRLGAVKAKLRKIQSERNAAEASLASTGAELAIGAGVLMEALDLMSDPEASYADGSDTIRRNINETFYQSFYLDENGVQTGDLNPPFEDFHAALAATTEKATATVVRSPKLPLTKQGPLTGASDRAHDHHSYSGLAISLADILSGTGSSKTSLVELRGLEPLTPTLPVWCATSCAIAP